ncbi:sensor histidine kinase [Streptomyces sp. NBC_00243]|uniref:sensor histidine kinase n=1 Tax=Streptomyces sp. NBC_00243 TaxID=2975688 RepID=UPI002DDC25AC|nr:sensor histidine kinase [Streptomyces sp. NBC_00243]WRZ20924.1 sensor histidine kinase [Streptomyces sp. NBC_00243]
MVTRAVVWALVVSSVLATGFALWVMTLPRTEPTGPPSAPAYVITIGVVTLAEVLTGAVLVGLRPQNVIGWIFLGVGASASWEQGLVAYGGYGLAEAPASWPGATFATIVAAGIFVPGWVAPPTLMMAFYPDGRLPGRWWRWPVSGAVAGTVVLTVVSPFDPDVHAFLFPGRPMPLTMPPAVFTWLMLGVCLPLLALSALAIWIGTGVRLLRSRPPERQLLAWLVCTEGPTMIASFYSSVMTRSAIPSAILSFLVLVAVAVGVLRYRMMGIETLLRQGLVYGVLTAAVIAVYLVVTVAVGSALHSHPLPGVLTAALVAVLLTPARNRLHRAADWLIHGERKDPLRAIAQLGDEVAVAGEQDLLPAALTAVMRAVRAPGAIVRAPGGQQVCEQGTLSVIGPVLPLRLGGRDLGTLKVAERTSAAPYDDADLRLLAALALQVATLLRALELTEALETERDRAVSATHAERDRIRRDLHDGLGPSLSGVGLGLQALADLLPADGNSADETSTAGTSTAGALLSRIRTEVTTAVGEIRRIIDGLRPTILDTLGLGEAVRQHAKTVSRAVPVEVDIADLPTLPPGVEATAYRIVTEALTNMARHAGARHARVTVTAVGGALHITVTDDGAGIPEQATAGVGLTSMRRRAQSLGGTFAISSVPGRTTVAATLPLEAV